MDVYVISMPERTERRDAMRSMLGRLGVAASAVTFVEPVKVTDVPAGYARNGMTPGYTSLNLTVRDKVFGLASKDRRRFEKYHGDQGADDDGFLVFEDDAIERVPAAVIMPRVREMLMDLSISGMPWDLVYLEYCMEHCKDQPVSVGRWLARASAPYCTAAVLYNRRSIDRIRRCLDDRKRLIDFSYVDCIASDQLNAYIAKPALFAQDAFYGAGDLSHMTPDKLQWWLNLVIRMYPDADAEGRRHGPRLPACLDGAEMLSYVRWDHVAVICVVCIACVTALCWRRQIRN